MKHSERKRLKKKMNRLFWWAYLIGLGGTALLFFVMLKILPLPIEEFWKICVILFSFFIPITVGLSLGMFASQKRYELYSVRRKLHDLRNKFHVRLFWNAIKNKDYDEAKRLYNIDNFIRGSFRVMCNGIIMGSLQLSGKDKDWKETADQRMENFLKDDV